MDLADLVASDYADRLRSYGQRSATRFFVEVAGLTVVSLGVDQPWGTQVIAMPGRPDAAAVSEAVAWCRARGRAPQVVVRERYRDVLPAYDVGEVLATLVSPAGGEQHVLAVDRATDVEEFRAVYGGSFGMPPGLADALVGPADLVALPHLLGRLDGRAVACAQVRPGVDLALVSGVGVLPEHRRRGYGTAMLEECRGEAARLGCELVWLNSSPETAPFYEGIGFERADTYVALTAS